jgi:AbrB family looped-hinge helix DNA binding protein
MPVARATSKGQITIPAAIRRRFGIEAGTKVEFVEDPDGSLRMVPQTLSARRLRGFFPPPKEPLTVEQMDEAVAAGAGEELT